MGQDLKDPIFCLKGHNLHSIWKFRKWWIISYIVAPETGSKSLLSRGLVKYHVMDYFADVEIIEDKTVLQGNW